jgi:hypothetical protein
MALTLEQARKIMRQTRDAFSERTVNKIFAKSSADPAVLPFETGSGDAWLLMKAEAASADAERKRELEKAMARNVTASHSINSELRLRNPPKSSGTPYERGKEMFTKGQIYKRTGNCLEQGAVAAYLAIKADATNRATTYVLTVEDPGDHVFCVVGASQKPAWRTVADMERGFALAIVIDPWMHFACYAAEYPRFASGKLQQWLARGKRIFWSGNDMKSNGWYQPAGDYEARFLDSPLSYEPAV